MAAVAASPQFPSYSTAGIVSSVHLHGGRCRLLFILHIRIQLPLIRYLGEHLQFWNLKQSYYENHGSEDHSSTHFFLGCPSRSRYIFRQKIVSTRDEGWPRRHRVRFTAGLFYFSNMSMYAPFIKPFCSYAPPPIVPASASPQTLKVRSLQRRPGAPASDLECISAAPSDLPPQNNRFRRNLFHQLKFIQVHLKSILWYVVSFDPPTFSRKY